MLAFISRVQLTDQQVSSYHTHKKFFWEASFYRSNPITQKSVLRIFIQYTKEWLFQNKNWHIPVALLPTILGVISVERGWGFLAPRTADHCLWLRRVLSPWRSLKPGQTDVTGRRSWHPVLQKAHKYIIHKVHDYICLHTGHISLCTVSSLKKFHCGFDCLFVFRWCHLDKDWRHKQIDKLF